MPNYFPSWLKPEVFAGVNFPPALSFLGVIRWYGVMYIVGLLIFLVLAHYQIRYYKDKLKTLGISIIAEDTGLNYGRTIEFSAETGELLVKSVGKENKVF